MDKQCSRCREWFTPEVFFRRTSTHMHMRRMAVCIGCENTARDNHKQENRWRQKARDTSNRHADKFIERGLASSRADFAERYGWNVDRMAHEAEHAFGSGCTYCGHRYLSMGHGLADITLDIVDRDAPPYYATNTTWCCATCNREKGRTPIHLWGAKLVAWSKWRQRQAELAWRQRQAELAEDSWHGTLFEGSNYRMIP